MFYYEYKVFVYIGTEFVFIQASLEILPKLLALFARHSAV